MQETGDRARAEAALREREKRVERLNIQQLCSEEAAHFREAWGKVQVRLVDEPRKAVEQADNLVAEAMKRLAEGFADERAKLEAQWYRGGDVWTEDLRLALRRYRSFFNRLLKI